MKLKRKEVRKTIKKLSFEEPKGTLAKSLLFLLLIAALIDFGLFSLARTLGYNFDSFIDLLTLIIVSPLILNYVKMFLMNSRDELFEVKDLFRFEKKSFKFMLFFTLVIIGYSIITYIFNLIPIIGSIINLILFIILIPVLFIMPYVFLEEDLNFKEFIGKSFKIIKGHMVEFYGMVFSFTLWFILGIFTFGILYFWLIPYFYIALTYLYLSFKKEKKFKKEKILSSEMIISLFVLGILIINIATFILVPQSFNDFKRSLGMSSGNTISTTLSYGGSKVNFEVPSDYTISSDTSTSKSYFKDDNILQYSLYLSNVDEMIEMDKEIINEYKNSSEYKSVSDEEFTVKVNNKNIKCYYYKTIKQDNTESSVIIAYYPKGSFVLTISLTGNTLHKNDIKDVIMVD